MNLFIRFLLALSTVSFAPYEVRCGGGRSSSGGGWRSSSTSYASSGSSGSFSSSSVSSSGSPGSSWSSSSSSFSSSSGSSGSSFSSSSSSSSSSLGSSSGSPGSSLGNSSGVPGSHSHSPSPRPDNSSGSSQSSGRDGPSPNRTDAFDSPSSSMNRSIDPRQQLNPSNNPVSDDHGGQFLDVYSAGLWRRRSWDLRSSTHNNSRGNSEDGHEIFSFGIDETDEPERPAPNIYDIFPSCEDFGEAMWIKYDELTQSGEMSSSGFQDDDPDVCIRQDVEKVRCAITENIQQQCIDEIVAFLRGGDICNEDYNESPS